MKNVFQGILFMLVLVMSAAFVTANPVLTDVADQSVNEGTQLVVALSSTAGATSSTFEFCLIPNGQAACTAATTPVTIGTSTANISTTSDTVGQFNWTPGFTQAGTYTFMASVKDDDSATTDNFTVTVNDVAPSLTSTTQLTLGSATQARSNPNHDTDTKKEINVTGTISVTNNGQPITDLTASLSIASGFTASDLLINYTLPKTTLGLGETISIPVEIRIPQKLDAVTTALVEGSVNVATVTFTSTALSTSASTALLLRAENQLEIKDMKVKFNGKSENVDNGDNVKDLKPGQLLEIEIEVESGFKDKEDVVIEDVEITVISDSEIDIDEDDDLGDLGPEDKERVSFTVELDEDADDGTYEVVISVVGVDEFGARHGEKWTVDFEVDRASHEISILSAVIDPATVVCEGQASLSTEIKNTGRRDEKDVYVRLASPELNFGAVSDELNLDRDDEENVYFSIPVPKGTAVGNYRITLNTYYNTGTKSDSEILLLSVGECSSTEDIVPPVAVDNDGSGIDVVVVTPPPVVDTSDDDATDVSAPEVPDKESFLDSPQYLALLALGYIVVLGGGAAVLIKMLK
jgi:hypothetical protein